MKPDDESLHAVPFDPVRDSLLSATYEDWEWIEGALSAAGDEHAQGWLAMLSEVRAGLYKPSPDLASTLKKLSRETRVAIHNALADDPAVAVPHKPLPVPGYKPQNDPAIQLVGANKLAEERSLRILDDLQKNPDVDQRWLAIGRTAMEQAWMAVNRAVFKPDRAKLPED